MTPSPTVPFRPLLARAVLSGFVLAAALAAGPAAAAGEAKGNNARATQDSGYALVQLDGEPLATYARTAPPKGKKVDFSSTTVKAYRALLSKQRNDYKAWLRANAPQARITGEFDISLNAVAVQLNGATLAQVSATSMVKLAQYQGLYYPNIVDPDLALINATDAWANKEGGTSATAGAGVKVAIVDSGIDVSHPCFSDSGYDAQTQVGSPWASSNICRRGVLSQPSTKGQKSTLPAAGSITPENEIPMAAIPANCARWDPISS